MVGNLTKDLCNPSEDEEEFQFKINDFWSDCGGKEPNITCSCCTVCCPGEQCD